MGWCWRISRRLYPVMSIKGCKEGRLRTAVKVTERRLSVEFELMISPSYMSRRITDCYTTGFGRYSNPKSLFKFVHKCCPWSKGEWVTDKVLVWSYGGERYMINKVTVDAIHDELFEMCCEMFK